MEEHEDKQKALEEFKSKMEQQINSHNLKMFAEAFVNRSDITNLLKDNLKCDALVIVGTKSSTGVHAAECMHSHMDKVSFIFTSLLSNLFFKLFTTSAVRFSRFSIILDDNECIFLVECIGY